MAKKSDFARNTKKDTDAKKFSRGRGKNNRSYSKRSGAGSSVSQGSENLITRNVTAMMPGSSGKYFPEDSFSMKAFGSRTTNPGQDNFIEDWNYVYTQTGNASDTPQVSFGSAYTKRAQNAMMIDVCQYFGGTAAATAWGTTSDPLQMAAVSLKQFIDTSFGTNTNYDTEDLMLYLLGVQAVFPLVAEVKRNLRLAITYQEGLYPQYIPRGIFTLLKISNDVGQYENGEGAIYTAKFLRSWIDELNQIIVQFNQLPIPPEISAFMYTDDLFDVIYADSENLQTAQLYIFRNREYWVYDEEADPYPMLRHFAHDGPITVGAQIERIRTIVNKLTALMTSSTAMLQNLYNAYGSKDLVKIASMEEANVSSVDIVYDRDMLTSIENLTIFDPESVTITNIAADPVNARCEGHIFYDQVNGDARCLINLPLQFHKAPEEMTSEDVGRAMRFHPSLRTRKSFTWYPGNGSRITGDHVAADGYTGFTIVRKLTMAVLQDDGTYLNYEAPSYGNAWAVRAADFKNSPIAMIATTAEGIPTLMSYFAHRDLEITYRLEDIRMFWTYLTINMYASDVNRNSTGSRTRYYK